MKLKANLPYYTIHLLSLAVLFAFHRYTISSPDTAHYLFISRYYLEGEFLQAVNSHWSPMVSWLLVPLLALRLEPLLAFFILQSLVSFAALGFWMALLDKIGLTRTFRTLAILLIIPLLVTGVVVLTPDFLTVALLLAYFLVVTKVEFGNSIRLAILAGLIGGLLFFTKSYSLPFFLAHFSVIHLVYFLLTRLRKSSFSTPALLKNYLTGIVTFILVITPWVLALSLKFGTFTYSNAGKYNIVNYGPQGGQHIYYDRLINPDTRYTRYDAFEEPSFFLTDWTPFTSISNLQYYIKRITPNLSSLYYLSYLRDLAVLVGLFFIAWAFAGRLMESRRWRLLLHALLVITIYTSGYLLLLIKARYLWVEYFLGSLCLWILVAHLWENIKIRRLVVFWVFAASVMILVNSQDMFRGYVVGRIYGQRLYALQEKVAQLPLENKNVASNIAKNGMTHSAMNNLFRYHSKFRHWGHLVNESLAQDGLRLAYDNGLDYFFLWNGPEYLDEVFRDVPVVLRDTTVGLVIFDLGREGR